MATKDMKEQSVAPRREYARIVLTLENVLVPVDKLSPTPSFADGLDSETEMDLRVLGCELIQTAGILLKLPQVAMATGQVIFQRFYYSKSFVKHNMEVVAMACINLASKIEEAPRRVRDVVNVVHRIKQIRVGKTMTPLILDQNYISLKNHVIKSERRVLKELGFCVHVKHPHKIIVMYMNVLEQNNNQRFVQCAWNYMNDSFRTNVFVRFSPETIACACIDLAARQLQIPLPANPLWYPLFDVKGEDIREICLAILRLYARKKPDPEKLEIVVNEAKKQHIEAKLKAKGLSSDGGTPISTSRAGTPTKVSPSPLAVTKIKLEEDKSDGSAGRANHNPRKKRGHSVSDDSRSHSRSQSRSPRDKSHSRTPYSSRSRSASRSPAVKRKYRDSPKKHKKDAGHHVAGADRPVRAGRHRARQHSASPHSRSRSRDQSPARKYKKLVKKHRSRSRTPDRDRHKVPKYRSRSRSRERSRKSKKHNGHRRSRSRDRYRR